MYISTRIRVKERNIYLSSERLLQLYFASLLLYLPYLRLFWRPCFPIPSFFLFPCPFFLLITVSFFVPFVFFLFPLPAPPFLIFLLRVLVSMSGKDLLKREVPPSKSALILGLRCRSEFLMGFVLQTVTAGNSTLLL